MVVSLHPKRLGRDPESDTITIELLPLYAEQVTVHAMGHLGDKSMMVGHICISEDALHPFFPEYVAFESHPQLSMTANCSTHLAVYPELKGGREVRHPQRLVRPHRALLALAVRRQSGG